MSADTSAHAHDSPEFIPLLSETARDFDISEISADKAYLATANLEAAASIGAQMFVEPKSNSTGTASELLAQLVRYYTYRKAEFMKHYNLRSNSESVMWMVKSKMQGTLRSKSPIAQVNEAYLKVLCHNLCVLVQSFFELGVDPSFYPTALASTSTIQ